MRSRLVGLFACAVLSTLLGYSCFSSPGVIALDFRAFYCAGAAMREGANPYRAPALTDCEVHRTDAQYRKLIPAATVPAPIPSYDVAVFGAISRLPFAVAKPLWGALLGFAIFIGVLATIRLTGLPAPLVFCAYSSALVGPSMALGQIVPLYFAAACVAMLFCAEEKYTYAGMAAAATLVEPHLGVPLCISLAVWVPASRVPLAAAVGLLMLAGLAALGFAQNVEYLTTVLPLHALSELTSDMQLSFSVVLHALGASDADAIRGGTLSYFAMLVSGVFLARFASRQFQNPAFLLAVPAATSVIGGPFLHGTDIVAAMPLVLLLLVSAPRVRVLALPALVLLAAPWWAEWEDTALLAPWFAFSGFAAFYLVWELGGRRIATSAAAGVAIFALLLELSMFYNAQRRDFLEQTHTASVTISSRYPEASWARVNRLMFSAQSSAVWLIRLSTWVGLSLAIAAVTLETRTRRVYAS